MSVLDVLTVAVLVVIGYRLASGARIAFTGRGREHIVEIVKGLRLRHFVFVIPVFALVILAITGLLQIPGMSFGWWTAIGGQGNPVTGGTDRTSGTVFAWLIPAIFLTMLLPALPLFAEAEERIFRLGSERRTLWGRVGKGVQFGLVHALIGIPIGAALALSIGGWYFTLMYLRGYKAGGPEAGLLESTRAHTAYNFEIICLIVVALIVL
jgi:hypothetical protein